jgi:hypothetical protein
MSPRPSLLCQDQPHPLIPSWALRFPSSISTSSPHGSAVDLNHQKLGSDLFAEEPGRSPLAPCFSPPVRFGPASRIPSSHRPGTGTGRYGSKRLSHRTIQYCLHRTVQYQLFCSLLGQSHYPRAVKVMVKSTNRCALLAPNSTPSMVTAEYQCQSKPLSVPLPW